MSESLVISVFSKEWYFSNSLSLLGLIFSLSFFYLITKSGYIKKKQLKAKITQIIGLLILFRYAISQTYQIFSDPVLWNVNHSLPFHLCGISGIVSGVILIRYNQTLYEFLLLLGAPGALLSFLTPQINIPEPSFMYFDYFLSHTLILYAPLYLTIMHNKRPRVGAWLKIFIKTNTIILPIVFIINIFLYYGLGYKDVNYIYLMKPPEAENPFIIGQWPYYIIGLQVVGFVHIILIYYVFNNYNKLRNYIQMNRLKVIENKRTN